jgi:hypothetical protein
MIGKGRKTAALLALFALASVGELLWAEEPRPPKRARPPEWSSDVLDVFFENALEMLEEERPHNDAAAVGNDNSQAGNLSAGDDSGAKRSWEKLIDAECLETEIKRLAQAVATEVTTPSAYKAGAYKMCRHRFSLLATLFGVTGEYEGEARWRDVAPSLREQFARAGRNSRAGTDQSYREAFERKQELLDLVAGSRRQLPSAERSVASWPDVADRSSLMQRIGLAQQEGLLKWLANEREFKSHADDVRHEAQIIAMLADVIAREGFDYWDDDQFAGYATELQQAATAVAAAAQQADFSQAQRAGARLTKACADCHEGYRG